MKIWTMGEILVEIMRPEADMPLGAPGVFMGPYPSGAPAIFIDTAARLGASCGIIGGVGRDDFGDMTLARLSRDGVDTRFVSRQEGATACAFVTYFANGDRRFIFHIAGTPAARALCPDGDMLAGDEPPAYFHVMGCSLTADETLRAEILKAARLFGSRGAKISFDPNIRPELLAGDLRALVSPILDDCAVLLPGEAELMLLYGKSSVDDAVGAAFTRPALEYIALKRGGRGCSIYGREGHICDCGVFEVTVRDATGAGDCFDAAFLCALMRDMTPRDAAVYASAAAALNTAAFGPMEGDISPETVSRMTAGHGASL